MRYLSSLFALVLFTLSASQSAAQDRPNILWLTSEDNGPNLGAYGDTFATTPNLDALAKRGMIYERCWSNAPVCAPARTTIIMGMYATSLGAHHMRSQVTLPEGMQMYPQILREQGYYCTNTSKEDYNIVKPGKVWDESSRSAHWKNRKPGQPFFAIFNDTITHESRMRDPEYAPRHDVKTVPIPAYHPDVPEVRRDWAHYYDRMEEMDANFGERLKELEEVGLADDTIVFYYGDHGAGMPRHKRWPYDSGLRVPLIVHVPDKWKHLAPDDYEVGGNSDRLVGFVDLGPTVISLAGTKPPAYMQGRAFMGEHAQSAKDFLFGYRGRMDERYDLVRSVTDGRYIYVRHYWPHRIEGQYLEYMFQTPTTRVWKELHDAGKLEPHQEVFWTQKPVEELFDLKNDPDEIRNLAKDADHREVLSRLREANRRLITESRDAGFLPEGEMHGRAEGRTVYEMAQDTDAYDLASILATAERATDTNRNNTDRLLREARSSDSGVRFWAAVGLLARGEDVAGEAKSALLTLLKDSAPDVRVAAAEALALYGSDEEAEAALKVLVEHSSINDNNFFVAVAALNALDYTGESVRKHADALIALPRVDPDRDRRFRNYINRLITKTVNDLGIEDPMRAE